MITQRLNGRLWVDWRVAFPFNNLDDNAREIGPFTVDRGPGWECYGFALDPNMIVLVWRLLD